MDTDFLIPFFVCVVLPISIVLIVSLRKRNSDNKRAEILINAIESGRDINTNSLLESFKNKFRVYSPKEVLYARLQRGCIFTLVGIALLIVYFAGVNHDYTAQMFLIIVGMIELAIGIGYLIVYFVTRSDILNDK